MIVSVVAGVGTYRPALSWVTPAGEVMDWKLMVALAAIVGSFMICPAVDIS